MPLYLFETKTEAALRLLCVTVKNALSILNGCFSHVFLVFKSIYTRLCTERVIYLCQTPALIIITLHEVASGHEGGDVELSETAGIHFGVCSSELHVGV